MKLTKQTLTEIRESFERAIQYQGFYALEHRWSTNGMGNSKIFHNHNLLSTAKGCGYDRFGKVLGDALMLVFPNEIFELAKKHQKTFGTSKTYIPTEFYGLFFNETEQKAWLDGACGHSCMETVLQEFGYELCRVGETDYKKSKGSVFYLIRKKVSEK